MTSGIDLVLSSLHFSRRAIQLSMIDLTEEQSLICLAEGAECAAWILEHAIFADHYVLRQMGTVGHDVPELSEDFAARFAVRDNNRSVWAAEVAELLPSFAAYRMAIIRSVANLTEVSLDLPINGVVLPGNEPSIPYATTGEMLFALSGYTSMLSGELSVIRVGLGRSALLDWL